jgi:two-component system phosphate regulon sensor histidine kinase PhoR
MIILRQKRLSEIQRDFINNMSHEFRTPITSIGLASQVIDDEAGGTNPERLRKYAGIVKDQVLVLRKKVDRILQQAETEHHFFRLSPQPVRVEEVISEITDEFRAAVEARNGRLEFRNLAPGAVVQADRYHFNGILINLVDNALKYTDAAPEVQITLREVKKALHLSVSDSGTGIDRKYLRMVFMPFFRVPSGNVHNVKGSGVGLSYVKKICDLHHWKVGIESEPGKGTIVSILIPKH